MNTSPYQKGGINDPSHYERNLPMTQNFDWLKWQTVSVMENPAVKVDETAVTTYASEDALTHFRNVGKTLMKYKYKALALVPKDASPAPYSLQVTRKHVLLSEASSHGAIQTRLVLADGSLWQDNKLADPNIEAHFVDMIHKIQSKLENNELKINTKKAEVI
jgi:hypothetical protein